MQNHRLLVIGTTGELDFIEQIRLAKQFHIVHVENLRTSEHVITAVKVNTSESDISNNEILKHYG